MSDLRRAGPDESRLLEAVLAGMRDGIVLLDERGEIVLHNPRATELGVISDGRVDERAREAAAIALGSGEPVDVDLSPYSPRLSRPSSVRALVRAVGRDDTGGSAIAMVDATDESETARVEATRRDFVANVGHELKTPVGGLALLAEAVLGCVDDPDEVRRFAGKILHESKRLGALVTELIELSRLQGGQVPENSTVVAVDEVVQQACARTALAAEAAGIDVTTDADSGLTVLGDRTLLVTAIANLVDNAISYSPHASPVSISRRLSEGFAEIAVTDRGIGIAAKHQERVFERFYRVDAARSRATGGTGLGLAIVKHVAANHGGDVRVWSRRGTGSTFTLRIPAHVVDDGRGRP